MTMKKQEENKKKDLSNDDVEKILDSTWDNWESRRKCEQTHTPEYKKKEEW